MQKKETKNKVIRTVDMTTRDYWRNKETDLRRNQKEIDTEMQRKREELAAEEKSFYAVCRWVQELETCLKPGILSPKAVRLILAIKKSISRQERYYNMDMIVEYSRRKKNSYIITNLMDKVHMSRICLKEITRDEDVKINQEEYDHMRFIMEEVGYEKKLYDEDIGRLRKLKEILEIIPF